MKKVNKISLVMAVMFATLISYANNPVGVNNDNDDVTKIKLINVTEGSVLSIKDVNGVVLYKETIKANGNYSKKFDLTAFPDGKYIFELDKEFEIKVIPFNVSLSKVVFDKESESVVFKPSIIKNNNFLQIHKSMLNKESFNINIYYENGDLVYSEKIKNEQIIRRVYNFSSSLKGNYRVELSNDDRTFTKEIKN